MDNQNPAAPPDTDSSPDKVELAITLDAKLLEQINHLTNNPRKVIDVAARQWWRGGMRRDDELSRPLYRNPPVPPRGEWND